MPRPKLQRKICNPPVMTGFKPYGMPRCAIETLILHLDEYEALRLCEYENLTQEKAAEKMNVSRPTLTRIYEKALKTIAKAFVEGKAITIDGGRVEFDEQWFKCCSCHGTFQRRQRTTTCTHCKSNHLININESLDNK
jgi:uncharacterized protein